MVGKNTELQKGLIRQQRELEALPDLQKKVITTKVFSHTLSAGSSQHLRYLLSSIMHSLIYNAPTLNSIFINEREVLCFKIVVTLCGKSCMLGLACFMNYVVWRWHPN